MNPFSFFGGFGCARPPGEAERHLTKKQGYFVEPVYISKRSFKNTWQEYRVYPDHLELQFWLGFHTIVIPFENIRAIEIRPPFSAGDLFRRKSFAFSFPLKVDASDIYRHIAIKRKRGIIKHIRFTPDDPDKFLSAIKSHAGHIGEITSA